MTTKLQISSQTQGWKQSNGVKRCKRKRCQACICALSLKVTHKCKPDTVFGYKVFIEKGDDKISLEEEHKKSKKKGIIFVASQAA